MRIIVTANHVPFVHGGADYHVEGLITQLRERGHSVEALKIPFKFHPHGDIVKAMAFCREFDLTNPNGVTVDKLISLQFPGYGFKHPDHVVWLMHQHRAVYELYGSGEDTEDLESLRREIVAYDNAVLAKVKKIFANSRRVQERLYHYNQIASEPLYHPPFGESLFYCESFDDFIFFPSRLERLKRQDLLIRAARYVRSPVVFLIGGEGGQRAYYQSLIDEFDLRHRVRLIGAFSEAEKLAYYAHALAVFFGPRDEDYGYVTLEAMLAGKPVITCEDSGGPTEFVVPGQTGLVLPPEPEVIAEHIDRLYEDKAWAEQLGAAGRAHYQCLNITWDNVVQKLLA
ncbi:glycosyltransferase family 4 protein [Candidatus Methylocalor cossyra]|uniref:Glycosyl transferase n=1 Tax=Candidatus Methylocalor cossyra TaxID=3108543 RepID=A0ABM9NJL5_9GAMM